MVLSRLPAGTVETTASARRWASGWFPLVGGLIGLASGTTQVALTALLGGWLGALAAVAVAVWITGALHEDGLADTADALAGARDRAQIFVILKDPRHGTYGVLAIAFTVLFRVAALERLGPWAPAAPVLAGLLSRTAMTWLLASQPYVTPREIARSTDVAAAGPAQWFLATSLCLLGGGLIILGGWLDVLPLLATLAVTAVVTALAGWRFHVRAGGITGDFLGAAAQATEIAALLTLVALQR